MLPRNKVPAESLRCSRVVALPSAPPQLSGVARCATYHRANESRSLSPEPNARKCYSCTPPDPSNESGRGISRP